MLALLSRSGEAHAEEPDQVEVRGPQAGGFVSRASIDDAPREITDAASLIEPLPGVHVRRLGADDSFATLSIRGTSSTQVAVYLAGVPLTGGADPTLDLATLPLWPGARARVFRSFAPAALGRGSLGGSLVIDAPSPRAPARTEVWTAAGAFGGLRLRIGDVRGEPDGIRVATGISASRSDDDFSYVDPRASVLRGREVFADRKNAGHAAASGLASVAIPVHLGAGRGAGALTVTTLLQARRQRLPGTATQPTLDQRLDSNRVVAALELTLPAGAGAFGVRGWGRREGLAITDSPESSMGLGPTSTSDAIIAAGTSVGWKGRPVESLSIEARVDGSAERFAPGSWQGALQPPGARRSNMGAAFDGALSLSRVTTLAASTRADAWFDTSEDGTSTEEARPTGNLGIETMVGPVGLASHAGAVARPPSFVERYGNRGTFIGDPGLRPESAATVDAGLRIARRLGALRLAFEAAVFGTWADDLIVFVPQGFYGRAKATNIGRARLLGTEAELRAGVGGFDLRLSHTALSTENQSACRFAGGGGSPRACERPPLPGRPAHDFVGDLSFTAGVVRIRYGIDVVTGISADNSGTYAYRVPDRVLHSAGARVAIPGAEGLSVALDVRNLFDLRIAEYPGVQIGSVAGKDPYPIGDFFDYPIPGRRILLSARWVFPESKASASVGAPK